MQGHVAEHLADDRKGSDMEDSAIVALYWERKESAIKETADKYGRYLMKIAWNILADRGDAEESVNDTYLHAWNAMPPHRPQILSTSFHRHIPQTEQCKKGRFGICLVTG